MNISSFEMSHLHRELLRKNGTFLVQNLHFDSLFLDFMQTNNILTNEMIQEIEDCNTKQAKVNRFLSILPKRGPKAFNTFIEALSVSDQCMISKKLIDSC